MPVLPVRADGASTLRPAALARFISFLLLALVLTGCFGGGGSGKILYVVGAATPSVALLKVSSSGALTASSTVASGASPDAILIAPNRKFAYVADSAGTTVAGGVSQYTLNGSGTRVTLTFIAGGTTAGTITVAAGTTKALRSDTVVIPTTMNPNSCEFTVQAFASAGDSSGSLVVKVYEVWVEGTE